MGEAVSPSHQQAAELILQSLFLTLDKTTRVQEALKQSQKAVQVGITGRNSFGLNPAVQFICMVPD